MAYILPSQYRTIFVKELVPFTSGYGYKENIHKFKLLVPDLKFSFKRNWEKTNFICELLKDGKQYFVPFLNVNIYNQVCIGDNIDPENEKELATQFFDSYFTFDITSSLYRIIYNDQLGIDDCRKDYLKFFAEWQKTGKFDFVKYNINH
jgi:hypothetical protein